MPALLIVAGAVLVAAVAMVYWRLSGPGRRLRVGAVNLYYSAVTADEAKGVGEYLERQRFEMDARLTREGPRYQLQLICYLGHRDERQDIACEVLAAGLSDDVFAGAAVEVHVCDRIFRPMSVVRHRGRFGRRIAMNAACLFYREGVSDAQAFAVATFLAGLGVFDDAPKIAQLCRNTGGYEFRLAVELDPQAPEMVDGARTLASDLSRVLVDLPVEVRFCKGLLGALLPIELREGECGVDNHVPGGPYRTEVFRTHGPRVHGNGHRDEEKT